MCKICSEAVGKYLPDLSIPQQHDILWSETSFPFGSAKQVEYELAQFAARRVVARILNRDIGLPMAMR